MSTAGIDNNPGIQRHPLPLLCLGLALCCGSIGWAGQATTHAAASANLTAASAGMPRNTIENRVEALSKALSLNGRQRAQLQQILEAQRTAVARIWGDSTLLPAERAPATRAVEQRTADQIREILSPQQRDKYNPPKPQSAKTQAPDVNKWMEAARKSQGGESP